MGNRTAQEIAEFLRSNGIRCEEMPVQGFMFLKAVFPANGSLNPSSSKTGSLKTIHILAVDIDADSQDQAERDQDTRRRAIDNYKAESVRRGPEREFRLITVTEDRWRSQQALYKSRILSHTGVFHNVFARNCEVRKIDRATANAFLAESHNYGAAACRYCYGLFIRRATGVSEKKDGRRLEAGTMVAVASFSNARKWKKGEQEIRSYEWVRYACLNGVRIAGGMGKVLKQFIRDVQPDDIMSYADLEWSDGDVYRQLGFKEDGVRPPVLFRISPEDWLRVPIRKSTSSEDLSAERSSSDEISIEGSSSDDGEDKKSAALYYKNCGSLKFRRKLTDYD